MSGLPVVEIRYLRPPDREQVFRQILVHDGEDVKVTLARDVSLESPLTIDRRVVLEAGSDVVWFTFPGRWHDIGRFHLADGTYTGLYANVLTPPSLEGFVWHTTDLYLDVWIPAAGPGAGEPHVLDRDELEEAVRRGWVDGPTGRRAEREADDVRDRAREGAWPPAVVEHWTLERVRAEVRGAGS